jgi:hypothetical protein
MSHWVEVIDPNTNEVVEELDEDQMCSRWYGYCGGCDNCLLMQVHFYGGFETRYKLIGPVQQ